MTILFLLTAWWYSTLIAWRCAEMYVEIPSIQGTALLPISPMIHINSRTYGNIFLEEGTKLYDIVKCESGFNPTVCNKEFGCKSGMGLGQLIPSTVRYCEANLKKEIDPFDPEDNLECCSWLLENEGTGHWGTAETDWGSYNCWNE